MTSVLFTLQCSNTTTGSLYTYYNTPILLDENIHYELGLVSFDICKSKGGNGVVVGRRHTTRAVSTDGLIRLDNSNNKFYYNSTKMIVIPEGVYTVKDLEILINRGMKVREYLSLRYNFLEQRLYIHSKYAIDFRYDDSIRYMFGMGNKLLEANTLYKSDLISPFRWSSHQRKIGTGNIFHYINDAGEPKFVVLPKDQLFDMDSLASYIVDKILELEQLAPLHSITNDDFQLTYDELRNVFTMKSKHSINFSPTDTFAEQLHFQSKTYMKDIVYLSDNLEPNVASPLPPPPPPPPPTSDTPPLATPSTSVEPTMPDIPSTDTSSSSSSSSDPLNITIPLPNLPESVVLPTVSESTDTNLPINETLPDLTIADPIPDISAPTFPTPPPSPDPHTIVIIPTPPPSPPVNTILHSTPVFDVINKSPLPLSEGNVFRIILHCNIITGSYRNNTPTHVLDEFLGSVDRDCIHYLPQHVIYMPLSVSYIHALSLRLTDEYNRLLSFNTPVDIWIRLHLKESASGSDAKRLKRFHLHY